MEFGKSARIEGLLERLGMNNFLAYWVEDAQSARELFFSTILPEAKPATISYADSLTLRATGILEALKQLGGIRFIDTFEKTVPWKDLIERRREALSADLFLTGTNAITEDGKLVNLDMIGNRINGIVFGPKNVVLTIGVNKIVKNVDDALRRIKRVSAPGNAKRHANFDLPCQKLGYCVDCRSEQRICNTWSIVEKCYPRHRIRIILINEELGL